MMLRTPHPRGLSSLHSYMFRATWDSSEILAKWLAEGRRERAREHESGEKTNGAERKRQRAARRLKRAESSRGQRAESREQRAETAFSRRRHLSPPLRAGRYVCKYIYIYIYIYRERDIHTYIYTYTYTYIYIYINIYININIYIYIYIHVCMYTYIYIYIYIYRSLRPARLPVTGQPGFQCGKAESCCFARRAQAHSKDLLFVVCCT